MKGHGLKLSRDMSGEWTVSFETSAYNAEALVTAYSDLQGDIDVEIKKYRHKRSLDANAYAWVLIGKIAYAQGLTRREVYRHAIREIGGNSDVVCVRNAGVEQLCRGWEKNGEGWQTDVQPSKIPGCANVTLYYGSSAYDTKQMSLLIDSLITDAKELGIETMTPTEIEKLKGAWL